MADEVDFANDHMARIMEARLGQLQQNVQVKVGARLCKDCGEAIPAARRQLGFQLCIECAEETERRESLFADY